MLFGLAQLFVWRSCVFVWTWQGNLFCWARAVNLFFCCASCSRSFLLRFNFRGLLLTFRRFLFVRWGQEKIILIMRGKLCVFHVRLARLFFGGGLSVFSLGFMRVVFCSGGGDGQNILFSSRG